MGKLPGKYGRNMSIDIFNNFYKGKRVLVTGHTGFKGSWLSIWLHELGAEVIGVGLEPFTERDNYVLSDIGKNIKADIRADIRDGGRMKAIFKEYEPELVFHLAAQPLKYGLVMIFRLRRTKPMFWEQLMSLKLSV